VAKGGLCIGLTTLPPSRADWEPHPSGNVRASPDLYLHDCSLWAWWVCTRSWK